MSSNTAIPRTSPDEALSSPARSAITKLESLISSLQNRISELQNENETLVSKVSDLSIDRVTLQSSIHELTLLLSKSSTTSPALSSPTSPTSSGAASGSESLDDRGVLPTRQYIAILQKERRVLRNQLLSLTEDSLELTSELETLRSDRQKYVEEVSSRWRELEARRRGKTLPRDEEIVSALSKKGRQLVRERDVLEEELSSRRDGDLAVSTDEGVRRLKESLAAGCLFQEPGRQESYSSETESESSSLSSTLSTTEERLLAEERVREEIRQKAADVAGDDSPEAIVPVLCRQLAHLRQKYEKRKRDNIAMLEKQEEMELLTQDQERKKLEEVRKVVERNIELQRDSIVLEQENERIQIKFDELQDEMHLFRKNRRVVALNDRFDRMLKAFRVRVDQMKSRRLQLEEFARKREAALEQETSGPNLELPPSVRNLGSEEGE